MLSPMSLSRKMALTAALLIAPIGAACATPPPPPTPTWITLGTSGGPPVRVERAQISNALVLPDGAAYLFDVGNDVQRQLARAHVPETAIKAVFISHHHLDHIADLGPVIWTHWTFGTGVLRIVGPAGTQAMVDGLVAASAPLTLAAYLGNGPDKPGVADMIAVTEIPADPKEAVEVYRDERIVVKAIGIDHYQAPARFALPAMPQAVAFRVETRERSIVYSGDTGPSLRLAQLAAGADLLVSEVIDLDAIARQMARDFAAQPPHVLEAVIGGMAQSHITAEEVGKVAGAAKVGRVVLTHFVPIPEAVPDRGAYARAIAKHYAGPVIMAEDLGRY